MDHEFKLGNNLQTSCKLNVKILNTKVTHYKILYKEQRELYFPCLYCQNTQAGLDVPRFPHENRISFMKDWAIKYESDLNFFISKPQIKTQRKIQESPGIEKISPTATLYKNSNL